MSGFIQSGFVQHGIAFMGCEPQVATIWQVKTSDRIALKRGTSQLAAVGVARQRLISFSGRGRCF